MTRSSAFPAGPARARHALDLYRNANGSGEAAPHELIARLLADLAELSREQGVNYGALIAHVQASWLHPTLNAPARPPPKRKSSLRRERRPV